MMSMFLMCLLSADFQLALKADTTIYRDSILLKDVLTHSSYSELKAMGVANLKVSDGPSFNKNRTIHRTLVSSRIRNVKPDLKVSYDGPMSTIVRRAGGVFSENQLRQAVQDFVDQQSVGDGTLHLEDLRMPAKVTLPPGKVRYEIRSRGNGFRLGKTSVYADLYVGEAKAKTLVVSLETSLETAVPVLLTDVSRGTALNDNNVAWEYRRITRIDGPMLIPEDLGSMRSRYILKQGAILTKRNTEGIPLVLRNTMVAVNVNKGPLRISLRAKALENGARGDLIRLQNVDSGQFLHGTVTPNGDVELRL